MSEKTTAVKISGCISLDIDLNGKFKGDSLANYTFNAEESLTSDLSYRCEIDEGLNSDDFDEGYGDTAFETWVCNYLKSEIERNQIKVDVVEFDPYYETGGFEGWDYVATLNVNWETLWDRWNNRNQS